LKEYFLIKREAWLKLKPEGLAIATRIRRIKKKKGVNYSLERK
jgi:hypothetical protein